MPEISDADLALYRGINKLVDDVWNNPKHGLAFKRAVKDVRPDASIPEVDVPEVVLKPLNEQLDRLTKSYEELKAEREKERQERADADLDAKFRKGLDTAKSRFSLTDEGVDKVIETMRERQIADPEAAAALYVASLPKSKPAGQRDASAYGGRSLTDFPGMRGESKTNHDMLYKDHASDMQFFDAEVAAVLNEFADQA